MLDVGIEQDQRISAEIGVVVFIFKRPAIDADHFILSPEHVRELVHDPAVYAHPMLGALSHLGRLDTVDAERENFIDPPQEAAFERRR